MAKLAARTQAKMDFTRADEKAAFESNSPEMEAGLNGVKLALKILNEYFAVLFSQMLVSKSKHEETVSIPKSS